MYFAGLMHTLDIILPVYNPLPGWEEIVRDRFQTIQSRFTDLTFKLLIVNDGSDQLNQIGNPTLLQQAFPNFEWISYKNNFGKGYALRQGVQKSEADFIVYTDIDWPYTEDSMAGMIQLLVDGADVVIGVRNEAYYKHLPRMRRNISRWLRKFNGKLLHLKVNDTQAGLKGFRKEVKSVFLATTINRYLFDLEFIYILSKSDRKMMSLPIALRPGITFSTMNRKILMQEAWNFLQIWKRYR